MSMQKTGKSSVVGVGSIESEENKDESVKKATKEQEKLVFKEKSPEIKKS